MTIKSAQAMLERSTWMPRILFGSCVLLAIVVNSGCKTRVGHAIATTVFRDHPPSVALLADAESEKGTVAHHRTLFGDALLREKLLEDGRATDGHLQTVAFQLEADLDRQSQGVAATIQPLEDDLALESANAPVDLQSLIATALAVHPRIQAARQRVAALSNRVPQVTALEDPVIGNTFWPIQDNALQTAGGRVGHQFNLSQKVPWPEKLTARGLVAQREAEVAAAEIAKAEREIVEAVRLAYYELWLAGRLIAIVKENQELARNLITIAEARYRTGGGQQDILRAEIERDKLDDQLISLRLQKEQARADLGTLVRQPIDLMPTAFETLQSLDVMPDLELLLAQAEQCNPNLQGLAAEIARDRAKQTLACLQQYPDFQLGLGYSIISDDQNVISPVANGQDNINFSVGVSLPIWRDKLNGGVREAAHQWNSSVQLKDAELDRLRGQLRRQIASAFAALEQLELFRERLLPKTEQALQIVTADYQGNKADFGDLIETYQEFLGYQVQVARLQATLASTLAQIERTTGCSL